MPAMMNVLIVRTSSMGDLIHTWPALTELVRHYPNLRISWLAEENFADIARLHPAVSEVITLAWRRWRKGLLSKSTWNEMKTMQRRLHGTKWDWVIDSQGLLKSAIPARFADGPLAGFNWKSVREPLACLLYNKTYSVSRKLSAVDRNRALFAQIFGYQVEGLPKFGIQAGLRPSWLPVDNYAVLLHATSRSSKEWSEKHWVDLGLQLRDQHGLKLVIPWGNEAEHQRAQRLCAQMSGSLVAPRLALHEAAALLGHARAVIGVDTGLTHLANALDVPLVAVYTDTDPRLTGVIETHSAINLGGIGQNPSVKQVLDALASRRGVA
jgi:heptosyltransferase-1